MRLSRAASSFRSIHASVQILLCHFDPALIKTRVNRNSINTPRARFLLHYPLLSPTEVRPQECLYYTPTIAASTRRGTYYASNTGAEAPRRNDGWQQWGSVGSLGGGGGPSCQPTLLSQASG